MKRIILSSLLFTSCVYAGTPTFSEDPTDIAEFKPVYIPVLRPPTPYPSLQLPVLNLSEFVDYAEQAPKPTKARKSKKNKRGKK